MKVESVDDVAGGSVPTPIPDGIAFRIIPKSGQAEFPRVVKLGTKQVLTVWDCGWQLAPTGGSIIIPTMALPPAASIKANTHAGDPELWTIQVADDVCVVQGGASDPRPARQTLLSKYDTYAQNDFTPIIDTLPWAYVTALFTNTTADGGTPALQGAGYDAAGNFDVNTTVTALVAVAGTRTALWFDNAVATGSEQNVGRGGNTLQSFFPSPRFLSFKHSNAATDSFTLEVIGHRR